jgi:hypothetical protein
MRCPNCGHVDDGYGQEEGYVICSECDCGDPTSMIGPHVTTATARRDEQLANG